jgi:hypothetical protein
MMAVPLGQHPDAEERRVTRPMKLAQVLELRQRWADYNEQHDLTPGQFVCEKQGLGLMNAEGHRTTVMMLWRLIDPNSVSDQIKIREWMERYPAGTNRFDCIVAYTTSDGHNTHFEAHELAQLRPATDADLMDPDL